MLTTKEVQSGMSPEEQRQFWAAYNSWLSTASDEEMSQLEEGLAQMQSQEVQHLSNAIRQQMTDERSRRTLPPNLVRQLEVAHWPAVAVNG